MKKKYRRLIMLVSIFVILIIVVSFINAPRDYVKNYNVLDMEIVESYNKHNSFYTFNITYDGIKYEIGVQHKYVNKKNMIKDIKTYVTSNEEKCIYPISELNLYPVCFDGENYLDYDLISEKSDEFFKRELSETVDDEFKNINIYNRNNNYLIWANKGYYFISKDQIKELMFLEKEFYYNNLAYQANEYVITPRYDEDYAFKTLYIINLKNGKVKKWELPFQINYNAYYLGEKDGLIYIFDRKEKREYTIDPKRKKIERIDKDGLGKVWNDGFESISTTKLANDDYKFNSDKHVKYEFSSLGRSTINGGSNDLIITKRESKFVFANSDSVYYLSGNILYSYDFLQGERELIKYEEWAFNNLNSIFVYKNNN